MEKNCLHCSKTFRGQSRTKYCSQSCYISRKQTREVRVAAFWSFVDKRGRDECWPWTGCTYNCGYGSFWWRGKMRGANRVSWEIANGRDAPDGMDVCHSCDKPLCVNPRHLFLATHRENMLDMRAKGRDNNNSSLNEDQVREIRRTYRKEGTYKAAPSNTKQLAEKFGVSAAVITSVVAGRSWKKRGLIV